VIATTGRNCFRYYFALFSLELYLEAYRSLLFSLKVFSVSKQFKIPKTVSFQKRPNASKIAKTLQNSEISLMVSITQPYQSGPLLWLWCMYQNQGRVAAPRAIKRRGAVARRGALHNFTV
jgi:hypothetical protein